MSHDTNHGHSQENTTIISFKNSFWLVVVLVGLFIAALNFVQVESAAEGHGGHEAATHEAHSGHESHDAKPAAHHEAPAAAHHEATEAPANEEAAPVEAHDHEAAH